MTLGDERNLVACYVAGVARAGSGGRRGGDHRAAPPVHAG